MAEPIIPGNEVDFDQPINDDPNAYSVVHVFSTDDITATFAGDTQGDPGATFIDFGATPKVGKTINGDIDLFPIDSEFGFVVTDFSGAEQKTIDGLHTEGWAGDLLIGGVQAGLVVSDSPTDTFKTPAVLGTWLSGLGGNSVKASTEHYHVMQNVLSDQKYAGDPDAVYPLDDDLILLSQNAAWNNQKVSDLLAAPVTFGVTDANEDGVLDIQDLLNPNESTIEYDIAYGADYSVTMKDDGKLLYRWGNTIKRPNDVRIEAELPLPDEFDYIDQATGLKQLFRITDAELITHHTITNNPNDQIRPEDFENESAIGTLPTFVIDPAYNADGLGVREVWLTTDDYYAGDGTLYPAGTILRDDLLASSVSGSLTDLSTSPMFDIGTESTDVEQGFTNAWYTTMDREPFEPVLTPEGDYETGPRWRLLPDKYGQDLPGVVIPLDPSAPLPTQNGEEKYEVGAETQTVINLLDWASPTSPLAISAGWQNNAGTVSGNGLNMTNNFDVAFYIKGDIKPATIYSTELLMSYEAVDLNAAGVRVDGGAESDFLVGINGNTFNGGAGEDLFVLSYAVSATGPESVTASVIEDFEVGVDKLGLIGFDALAGFDVDVLADRQKIQQAAVGDDLTVSVDGVLVATLTGVAADLGVAGGPTTDVDPGEGLDLLESFLITNPGEGVAPPVGAAEWSITGDVGVAEGGTANYTLSLVSTLSVGGTATVDLALTDIDTDATDYASFVDAVNAAIAARPELAFDGTTLTYTSDGTAMADIVIALGAVDDGVPEGFEDFSVSLSNPGGTGTVTVNSASASVTTTISETDPLNQIIGTEASEFLRGTEEGDMIFGLGGNDYLFGLGADDVLIGGTGSDRLYGGAGSDTFVMHEGGGIDYIIGFEDGIDKIGLDDGLTFADVTITSNAFYISVFADDIGMRISNVTGLSITADDFAIV